MVLTFDSYKETLESQEAKEKQIKNLVSRLNEYEEANKEGRIMSNTTQEDSKNSKRDLTNLLQN